MQFKLLIAINLTKKSFVPRNFNNHKVYTYVDDLTIFNVNTFFKFSLYQCVFIASVTFI